MATVEAQTEEEKVMGPVDYLVVLFPEGGLTGKIAPELRRLSDAGIIRVIDLLIIQKDANGDVDSFEVSEVGGELEEELHVFEPKTKGWLSQEDVEAIGDGMPNRSIAVAMLFENLWAIGVKKAVVDSGGELLESGRIPPELIERAQSESSTITIKEG